LCVQINLTETEATIQDILNALESTANNTINEMDATLDHSELNLSQKETNDSVNDDEKENVETSPKRLYNIWTDEEVLSLVYLVDKIGKDFSKIITNYEQYFPNRTKEHLSNKYYQLKIKGKNGNFKNLQNQAKLLIDIPILKNDELREEKNVILNWKLKEV
jgi:hypothetical protein